MEGCRNRLWKNQHVIIREREMGKGDREGVRGGGGGVGEKSGKSERV